MMRALVGVYVVLLLAAAQPSRNDRSRTIEDNKAAASAINHPISEDVAFARMNKPNDFRLRNLFFQQDVSVYSSVTETARIRANTFNANGKKPNEKLDIRDWLMNDDGDDAVVELAVGFQEIVPLGAESIESARRGARRMDVDEKILRCLNSVSARNGVGGGYVKITSVQLVGVYLTIFVREELIRKGSIRERPPRRKSRLDFFGIRDGAMNVKLGNKGGCCALIKIRDTTIAFVCAHLAAGSKEEDAKRRNADAAEILQKCVFAPDEDEQGEDERDFRSSNSIRWEKPSRTRTIHDATVSIFFGDLNYRLNAPKDDVLEHVRLKSNEAELNASSFRASASNYIPFLKHDQLLNEMQSGSVLPGYREGSIEFL